MGKLYTSKIDNKSFASKEDLVKHLLNNYMMVDETGGESTELHSRLQEAFPFAKISIEESDSEEYGKYVVTMVWKEFNSDFTFFLGEHTDYDYYYQSFNTVDDTIRYYQSFIERKTEITDKLYKKYSPSNVTVHQMYEGDMNSENGIHFSIQVGGKNYYEHYHFGDVNEFVNSFSGYFDTVIEGNVILERDHASGYDKEPRVDGVPLKNILQRAKKIRIEILELK